MKYGSGVTGIFPSLCLAMKLPEPTPEYQFAPPRRWRFDWAFVDAKVAVEVEGGIFIQGRHSRGAGMKADMEKYNTAAILGWRLLRCTSEQFNSGDILDLVRKIFGLT